MSDSNLPISAAEIKAQMAAEVDAVKDRITAATGNKIQIRNKTFIFPDGGEADTFDAVIVEFTNRNLFYDTGYDPDNIAPPSCYSVGPILADMIPAENVEDKQSDSCASCPMNAFGSAGRGKACKNQRRLAVLPADSTGAHDEILMLDVSPTAIKRFDKLVSDLRRDGNMLPIGAVVEVGFDPDSTYASLTFSLVGPNENVVHHWARRAEAAELINQEIDYSAFEDDAPKKKAAPKRKATTRRR